MVRWVILLALLLTTQSQPKPLFEVAVIKPVAQPVNANRSGCRGIDTQFPVNDPRNSIPLGRCVFSGTRADSLITNAYGLRPAQLRGTPNWATGSTGERFALDAKAEKPETTTEQQLREMLQSLLADRFKLRYRRDTLDVDGFHLVLEKDGPKFQTVAGDEEPYDLKVVDLRATLTATRTSMSSLAQALSTFNLCLGAPLSPVADKTGLKGVFAFTMRWTQCRGDIIPGSDGTIPYALKELGLKLGSGKVPVEFFIIENMERPVD